jgi:hypothetical protein
MEMEKMNRVLLTAAVSLVLSAAACAPAPPTVDPAQIQASAVAAANTMIAMTQAAIPAPTEVPPTPLPSPTPLPTLAALPTLPLSVPTLAPTQSTTDSCRQPFDLSATGNARAKLMIKNNTKGPVTLTLGMSTKNAFGQCGYMSWSNIPKMGSITVYVPQTGQGPCYWAYAWINDPKQQRNLSPTTAFCMNNSDKWTMNVTYDNITLTPP